MADKYRIVSDGNKTRIYTQDGLELRNVTSLKLTQSSDCRVLMAEITLLIIRPVVDIEVAGGVENG